MAKVFLKGQNIPTKPCPKCHAGTIYTGERAKSLNLVLNGQAVCEDCVVKELVNQHHNKGGEPYVTQICLGCGNNIGAGETHWEECSVGGEAP